MLGDGDGDGGRGAEVACTEIRLASICCCSFIFTLFPCTFDFNGMVCLNLSTQLRHDRITKQRIHREFYWRSIWNRFSNDIIQY